MAAATATTGGAARGDFRETVVAPEAMAASTVRSVTALQWHTTIVEPQVMTGAGIGDPEAHVAAA